MKNQSSKVETHYLVNVPSSPSHVSYVGSYWNEIEKDTNYQVFDIFEVLAFNCKNLYSHASDFEIVSIPKIDDDDAVYNYLLAKTKEILSLSDDEVNLASNWRIGRVMNDGFYLFFEAEQYMFLKTPNYYDDDETRLERRAFRSLLSKVKDSFARQIQ